MAIKTIALTGSEVKATGLDGENVHIRNDGADVIYASKAANITAGADGVLAIHAGQSATVYGTRGTIFLSGTGSVQLVSNDYTESSFKTSAQSGSSGADEVARAAITTHSGNSEIHVTAAEKAAWNKIGYSNPNLLDNPDFRINQRGAASGSNTGNIPEYCVDRWKYIGSFEKTDSGIIFSAENSVYGYGTFTQITDIPAESIADITLSAWVNNERKTASGALDTIKIDFDGGYIRTEESNGKIAVLGIVYSGSSMNVNKVKLEAGSTATMFIQPDYAEELIKCQSYYQIRSNGDIQAVDLRPGMRAAPAVSQLSDGNFSYSAEP